MSFSSRRRNYHLVPHRKDELIGWMKSMLIHSFVLDALESTAGDTFSHFEQLINEHLHISKSQDPPNSSNGTNGSNKYHQVSRLKQIVPTVGTFHTPLPLRKAFEVYNAKYAITKRKHICISFNEIRHILNLAQIMAFVEEGRRMRGLSMSCHGDDDEEFIHNSNTNDTTNKNDSEPYTSDFHGPKLITFDGDQTLYSDGANFESNSELAHYIYLLLLNGVYVAVVTAAGYEYMTEKYELRLSGLLSYFKKQKLAEDCCSRFFIFGGECNYLLRLGCDYKLHAVKEHGVGGWKSSTRYLPETPSNWPESDITTLLDIVEESLTHSISDLKLRARVLRKKRAIGLIPIKSNDQLPREGLDEVVLRIQTTLTSKDNANNINHLPFCAFNGGNDVFVDVGNKRVGVQILQSFCDIKVEETLHIGDQFLKSAGNDRAARDVCPCVWIISPDETTYILKNILRLAGVISHGDEETIQQNGDIDDNDNISCEKKGDISGDSAVTIDSNIKNASVDIDEMTRRFSLTEK